MDISLPDNLRQRIRWVQTPEEAAGGPGQFVLYWMHNALRAHENPALDAAICFARQNGLPLLVYHGLSEQYPYASDRHHAFMLQGHRDVQRELEDRGIVAAFHLQRCGQRGPYLRNLARSAAVLVTEEMPVQPIVGWMERLVATCQTPVATVDCACLAPVTAVGRPFTRAFQFREAVQDIHDHALQTPYVEQLIDVAMCDLDDLKRRFDLHPLSLQDADLASLIGCCRVDHSVAPVAETPGGSKAGYARWEAFKKNGLADYEATRNDPLAASGASRMSAYLHYGMVSPFRIAREADALNATKYLDELLTWRELAFHFCFHHPDDIDSLDAVPTWAKECLRDHRDDPREKDCSWESLARGRSGHPLWDSAQRSLLKHGELHNNVRMTWGKAFLNWTLCPERALQLALDLNHRYALDGRNPSSYGGVLWCFGQFDRPFSPEQPIFGKVRTRELKTHAKRLNLDRYRMKVDRPIAARLPNVAIIGAGIGGLIAARVLSDHGINVSVFERREQVGGRTAALHMPSGQSDRDVTFDLGAQYFTASDSTFCRYVNGWVQDGIVQSWLGKIVSIDGNGRLLDESHDRPRYVGVPSMNAMAIHLAKDLPVTFAKQVIAVEAEGERWRLRFADGEQNGPFDLVLSNCPAPETFDLIGGLTSLGRKIRRVKMRPCWAAMLTNDRLVDLSFDAAFVRSGPLSWIASSDGKPGRKSGGHWVAHASADWSLEHAKDSPERVADHLGKAFAEAIGRSYETSWRVSTHFWENSETTEPLDVDCLFDFTTGLGACGDWCRGRRLESAFISGIALAGAVLRRYTIDRPPAPRGQASQPRLFV
ncbi:FAD-dependent oxidoreductase [Roseiconus lacunae]|uniref:FAD-dependent oxidoreductase n=1 Tax=Roseiconus lacunae TaxID=2605694 RepID=UPI001E46A1AB|nr:FAD-dependent oxidoreductase [Roseiconus lacunae]MCD0458337.1 FAD-dependent oxidoreductase [Roseiconus lacunae]